MKKLLLFLSLLFFPFVALAKEDVINNFSMDIYIDNNGDAYVTEKWDATANMGSEFYRSYYNYGNSEFSDYTVTMDNKEYTFVDSWDINATITDKAYKNGFNYTDNGIEICFGKTSLGKHQYISKYKISNFVLSLEDADMVYWTLLPYNNGGQFQDIYIKIHSDFLYEDSLDVWGYGNYGGTAYVYDGVIEMGSDGALNNNEYMTILVKFPKGTFNATNVSDNNFDHYYTLADDGATHYIDETDNMDVWEIVFGIFNTFIWIFVIIFSIIRASKNAGVGKYRLNYGDNYKKISKDTPNYRDIPCSKNIYHAYFISSAYSLTKKKTDVLGAVLLKWLKEGKITTEKTTSKIFKKESTAIVLNDVTFENELETELYTMMKESSKDGILEENEFERWCKNHYNEILKWFDKVLNNAGSKFEENGYLIKEEKKGIFSANKYLVTDKMYEEAKKLYGLKNYLIEFSRIEEKQPIEVNLWEEYLMYAQIFGIAKEVAKQFKKLYPEFVKNYNYDYDTIIFLNHISASGIASASTAKSRAEGYDAGGGGFSSGGGGGGSFGGGGFGGAGGR